MSLQLAADDPWVRRGYGQARIDPGERPAVLVIDLQYAFTDPEFEFGGTELIERATVNTARPVGAARAAGGPGVGGGRPGAAACAGRRPTLRARHRPGEPPDDDPCPGWRRTGCCRVGGCRDGRPRMRVAADSQQPWRRAELTGRARAPRR